MTQVAESSPMRRGLKGTSPAPRTTSWRAVAESSPMRRGLKDDALGMIGAAPIGRRIFPDEEGTERSTDSGAAAAAGRSQNLPR